MNKWINILEETPRLDGIYKCFIYNQYHNPVWYEKYLQWNGSDFMTIEGEKKISFIDDITVVFWLKLEVTKNPPIELAEKYLIKTQIFSDTKELLEFAKKNNIPVYYKTFCNTEYVITGLDIYTIDRMRTMAESFTINVRLKR